MAKEIDLIMNQKNAPPELLAAVAAHQKNYNALLNATTKATNAKDALKAAQAAFDQSAEAYQKLLNDWKVTV